MIHKWTKEEDLYLMTNRANGYPKIAQALSVSEDQAWRRYKNLMRAAISSTHDRESIINSTAEVIKGLSNGSTKKSKLPDCSGKNYMLEVSACDLHLGKLAYGKETGAEDYDIKIASEIFKDKILELLAETSAYPINRYLFVVGNDFFHTEFTGMTTKGTPQHSDSRWQKVFTLGMTLITNIVDLMSSYAPVTILCVPGNHDNASNFYLGCALEAYYKNNENVSIDNEPTQRKYVVFGTNLIGFTHGDREKHDSLPMILASEQPEAWAKTTCREFHLGHWHQRAGIKYGQYETVDGVTLRKLPSLSATDSWHSAMGYCMPQRALEAYLYEKTTGYRAHFSANFIEKAKNAKAK